MRAHRTFTLAAALAMSFFTCMQAKAESVRTHVVLQFSTSIEPIYLYQCLDKSCSISTQLEENGYVTREPDWNGKKGLTPWAFLNTEGRDAWYLLWQKNSQGGWNRCQLSLTATGELSTTDKNDCIGSVLVAESTSDSVSAISFGVAHGLISEHAVNDAPATPRQYIDFPKRTITFLNRSDANNICINYNNNIRAPLCDNSGSDPYTFSLGSPTAAGHAIAMSPSGEDSIMAMVIGIKRKPGGSWQRTGQNLSKSFPAYFSVFEWTFWPQTSAGADSVDTSTHTVGATTNDVSLVNGFNVGHRFYPDKPAVCARSNREGGPLVFHLYSREAPMSQFPINTALAGSCPNTKSKGGDPSHMAKSEDDAIQLGCYSDCSHAIKIKSKDVNKYCCTGQYHSVTACTGAIRRPYSDLIDKTSINSYSWAYDDFRGTFTCDPTASYTYEITKTAF